MRENHWKKSFSLFRSGIPNEKTSVSNVILRNLMRNGAFLIVFGGFSFWILVFRFAFPNADQKKRFSNLLLRVSNLKRWIAD